jgi:GWxTD domain-containing protein
MNFKVSGSISAPKLIVFIVAIVCCFIAAPARAIQAVVTHNIFHIPSEGNSLILEPYLEIYWQIDPLTIQFEKVDGKLKGRIRTDVILTNEKGTVNQDHYILQTLAVDHPDQALALNIMDLRRFGLKEGKYVIELHLQDLNDHSNKFTFKDSFSVSSVSTPFFSDILLIDTSIVSDVENEFQRNNKLQIPLNTNFLDDRRKSISYYAELYNTHTMAVNESVIVKAYISRKELGPALNQLLNVDSMSGRLLSIAEGRLPVVSLSSGNYYLNLVAENAARERLAAKSLFFQVINTKPTVQEERTLEETAKENFINLNKTFVAKYTAPQVKAILKMLLPIAEPVERNSINAFLKQPDEMYSRYFIYNFWMNRDKANPEKRWKEYAEQVKEANKLFGSSLLPGYETDRGRIYLKYGKPSDRVVVENEVGALPYEVWQYNALPAIGNAVFLFYRPGMIANDYKLLHSSVTNEVRNRAWRNYLYNAASEVQNGIRNSRAEQYLENR